MVSCEILGVREAAFDLYFQKSLKPWRWKPQQRLGLDNDEGLFPGSYHPGQKHEEDAVRLGTGRSFHLSPQDEKLLT